MASHQPEQFKATHLQIPNGLSMARLGLAPFMTQKENHELSHS